MLVSFNCYLTVARAWTLALPRRASESAVEEKEGGLVADLVGDLLVDENESVVGLGVAVAN